MKNFFKLLLIAIFGIAVFGFIGVSPVKALTEQEKQELILQLQQQIALLTQQLQQMLAQQGTTSGIAGWCHTFNRNLGVGDKTCAGDSDIEVASLENVLIHEGLITQHSGDCVYFDNKMAVAVSAFQEKYKNEILTPIGLSNGNGYFGARTRSKINLIYGCLTGDIVNQNTSCASNWSCSNWSACSNSLRTRTCTDTNNCLTPTNSPSLSESCTVSCSPVWSCGAWSTCTNSVSTRSCTDSNHCGTITGQPATSQACTTSCNPNWSCNEWSSCVNSARTRTCSDLNNCNILSGKPAVTETCNSTCNPDWVCEEWSSCVNSTRTRACYDSNICGVTINKPVTSEACTPVTNCTPDWECGLWSTCPNWSTSTPNAQTSRTCWDNNSCGTSAGKPATSGSCASQCAKPENWSCGLWGDCKNGQKQRGCTDLNSCAYRQMYKTETAQCNQVAPTVDLKANDQDGPLTVPTGSSVVLSWKTTDADTCTAIDDWAGPKAPNLANPESSQAITSSKKFSLKCTNPLGTATDTVLVNVTTGLTVNIKAKMEGDTQFSEGPVTAKNSSKIVLSWSTTNAVSCIASDDWSGFKTTGGEETLPGLTLTGSVIYKTYTITCRGIDGTTAKDSVIIKTEENLYPTVADLKIFGSDGPVTISSTQSSLQLSWTSSSARQCFLSYNTGTATWIGLGINGGTQVELMGTKTISITPGTKYTFLLQCYGNSLDPSNDRIDVNPMVTGKVTTSILGPTNFPGICYAGRECAFTATTSTPGVFGQTALVSDVDILNGTTVVYNACTNSNGSCKWLVPQDMVFPATTVSALTLPSKTFTVSFHLGPLEYARQTITIYPGLMIFPKVSSLSCMIGSTCKLEWTTKGVSNNMVDQNRARLSITDSAGNLKQDLWGTALCDASTNSAQYCTFIVRDYVEPGNYEIRFVDIKTNYKFVSVPVTITK